MILHNDERRNWLQPWKPSSQGLEAPVCSMALPPAVGSAWAGPRIRMQLPSFSGATAECPQLLQYTCQLSTNVRAVPAAIVEVRTLSPSLFFNSMHCRSPRILSRVHCSCTKKEAGPFDCISWGITMVNLSSWQVNVT